MIEFDFNTPVVNMDISKGCLDVAPWPDTDSDISLLAEDIKGHAELFTHIQRLCSRLIVFESPGGHQRPVVAAVAAQKFAGHSSLDCELDVASGIQAELSLPG